MTSRREILAETLARLEAERYSPPLRWELIRARLPPITPEEAEENRRILLEAINDDEPIPQLRPHSVHWRTA